MPEKVKKLNLWQEAGRYELTYPTKRILKPTGGETLKKCTFMWFDYKPLNKPVQILKM